MNETHCLVENIWPYFVFLLNYLLDIDILEALNISDGMRGVSEIQGSQPQNKAWRLHTAFDHVQIPENNASQLFSKLTDQMTVEFIYKQHRKTVATLLSINSPGKMSPWFRITSNTKLNKLFIFYRIMEDSKLHEKIFNLHDVHRIDNWTKLAVSINGTKLLLNLDCRPPDKQELAGHIYLQFPKDSLIYFRQEPGFKKKLLVCYFRIESTNMSVEIKLYNAIIYFFSRVLSKLQESRPLMSQISQNGNV